MSVLYGWAMVLAVSAIVPIVLHFRKRQTDRRVAFPALRYLTRAEDARSRSLVASDILLLAVRIGLILALALAAAGPLLGRGGARDHPPTDVALIVDNSASVGRLTENGFLFDDLVSRAQEALEVASPEDRIWLFPSVGDPLATGVSRARAIEALATLQITDGAADLVQTVARASATLPTDGERQREVQLVSDLQAAGLTTHIEYEGDTAPIIAYVPPPPVEANAALAALELTGGTTVPSGIGHGVTVRTELKGGETLSPGETVTDADIRIDVDGRVVGASRAPWGASSTLGLPELSIGPHVGQVEVSAAGSRADDIRYFSMRVVSPPTIDFEGPEDSFIRIGIQTLIQAGRLGSSSRASIVVLEGDAAQGTSWPEVSTLILVPPSDPIDLPAFNQKLSVLGVDIQAHVDPAHGDLGFEESTATFSLSGVRVRSRYLLRSGGGPANVDTTLLTNEDGEPWLVRKKQGERLILLVASPFTSEAIDLPSHPTMIPFLEALLVYWSHFSSWPPSDFEAGSTIPLPRWVNEIIAPDGSTRPVAKGTVYSPALAGVYTAHGVNPDGAYRETQFAVNVPAMEIDPTPLPRADLASMFPGRTVFTAGPKGDSWTTTVFRVRRGRDITIGLLVVTLALVAIELFLATPGRSGQSTGDGETAQARSESRSGASS